MENKLLKHSQVAPGWYGIHEVSFEEGSKIEAIMGVKAIRVNSFHHQAVCKPAPGFSITAWSLTGSGGYRICKTSICYRVNGTERMWEKIAGCSTLCCLNPRLQDM